MYVEMGEGKARCGVARVKRYATTLLGRTRIEERFGEQHDRQNSCLCRFSACGRACGGYEVGETGVMCATVTSTLAKDQGGLSLAWSKFVS